MGFIKKFFRNAVEPGTRAQRASSFAQVSRHDLEAHLEVNCYGSFELTDAVRPSYDLQVIPRQGFRHDVYNDEESSASVPVLMASASKDYLFDLFMEMLDPLGANVDVVLETSHNHDGRGHLDLYREHIDMPVLKSILWDYEETLLHDGCTGIAVLNPNVPLEIQFDEHKLLIVYGNELREFENVLVGRDVYPDEQIKFITEAEHVHSSSDEYWQQFEDLSTRLGMDCAF